jgi:hypothetical protein
MTAVTLIQCLKTLRYYKSMQEKTLYKSTTEKVIKIIQNMYSI